MMPQTHKNTHSIFVQKEAESKQIKGVIRLVPMLVTGCKNQRSKRGKTEQRTRAAQGSLHETCVEMQNPFTGSSLKEKLSFLTGFWVTDCYLI